MRSPAIRASEEVQVEVAATATIEGEAAIADVVGVVRAGEDTTRARAMEIHMEEEVVQGADLGIATAGVLRTSIKTYRHIPRRLRTATLPT
jgi:hypothetical protein